MGAHEKKPDALPFNKKECWPFIAGIKLFWGFHTTSMNTVITLHCDFYHSFNILILLLCSTNDVVHVTEWLAFHTSPNMVFIYQFDNSFFDLANLDCTPFIGILWCNLYLVEGYSTFSTFITSLTPKLNYFSSLPTCKQQMKAQSDVSELMRLCNLLAFILNILLYFVFFVVLNVNDVGGIILNKEL